MDIEVRIFFGGGQILAIQELINQYINNIKINQSISSNIGNYYLNYIPLGIFFSDDYIIIFQFIYKPIIDLYSPTFNEDTYHHPHYDLHPNDNINMPKSPKSYLYVLFNPIQQRQPWKNVLKFFHIAILSILPRSSRKIILN